MWIKISALIIRNRILFIGLFLGLTVFFGYFALQSKLSFESPQLVPNTDEDLLYYKSFTEKFGNDNNLIIIGFNNKDVFHTEVYNDYRKLADSLNNYEGVSNVAYLGNLVALQKDTQPNEEGIVPKRFIINRIFDTLVQNQKQADSLRDIITSYPFYDGLFYVPGNQSSLMAINLKKETMESSDRLKALDFIQLKAENFAKKHSIKMHYSGLPFIRTKFGLKVQKELNLFLFLSILITAIILFIFFKSLSAVIFPLIFIFIIIIWSFGIMVLFGFQITLLTALLPPLIVIIAVPNFIYFLTRYHTEYIKYRNKYVAIAKMLQNISQVVFLNNFTTAIGFGVLYFVKTPMMREFGILAFIMIITIFISTFILLPLILSYMPLPSTKNTKYLENNILNIFLDRIIYVSNYKIKAVMGISLAIMVIAIIGVQKLKAEGYILDDIPQGDEIREDVKFFEENFEGIMPYEIVINTQKKNGLLDLTTLQKISDIQDSLEQINGFARTISVADFAKFTRQAFFNGSVSRYSVPSQREQMFLSPYLRNNKLMGSSSLGIRLTDSLFSEARISGRMHDVGSARLNVLIDSLNHVITNTINDENITHRFTGFSRVFLKGNQYLVSSLYSGLAWAIALITLVIAVMFRSIRLVLITIIPNVLALLITASIMGYFGISLKPSSILVFTVAFGIAIDASFHFLFRYRQDLKMHNWDVKKTVAISLKETGLSIVYTSLILLFGFGIFLLSSFGSTFNLGLLTSITLICALFTNIVLIPALLCAFDKEPKRLWGKKKQ